MLQMDRRACPHCAATFTLAGNYRRHMRLHTGVKPFKCALCPYAANRKEHLLSHNFRKHQALPSNQSMPDFARIFPASSGEGNKIDSFDFEMNK